MKLHTKHLGVLILLLACSVPSAWAQSFSGFGVKGGLSLAQLRGEDDTSDRRLGFAVGVFGTIPLGPALALQPEVLYVQKGGEFDEGDDIAENASFNFDYVEVPVLVKLTLPTGGTLVPSLYAGPYGSYATNREFEFEADGIGGSIDAEDVIERIDYGVVIGADLGFVFAGRGATLGLRYDLGLANIAKDDDAFIDEDVDLRTGTFLVMIGFAL